MDPRQKAFADIMDTVSFSDDEVLEGEVVGEEPVEQEPQPLSINALMQEAFGNL